MAKLVNILSGETRRAETDDRPWSLSQRHRKDVREEDLLKLISRRTGSMRTPVASACSLRARKHIWKMDILNLRNMSMRLFATIVVGTMAFLLACGGSVEETNRAVVLNFVDEFKNRANHNIVDELFTADFVHHFKDPRLPPGREAMKFLGQSVVMGFPDVRVTVEDLFADGDFVIERTTARGTHTGEFFGVPATNGPVTWTEIHIYRLQDGKVAELWSEVDFISLMTQIGAIPGP